MAPAFVASLRVGSADQSLRFASSVAVAPRMPSGAQARLIPLASRRTLLSGPLLESVHLQFVFVHSLSPIHAYQSRAIDCAAAVHDLDGLHNFRRVSLAATARANAWSPPWHIFAVFAPVPRDPNGAGAAAVLAVLRLVFARHAQCFATNLRHHTADAAFGAHDRVPVVVASDNLNHLIHAEAGAWLVFGGHYHSPGLTPLRCGLPLS